MLTNLLESYFNPPNSLGIDREVTTSACSLTISILSNLKWNLHCWAFYSV